MKKASLFGFETITKILLVLGLAIVLIAIIWSMRDNSFNLLKIFSRLGR
ncbi:hypothetical protein N9934_01120 [Desulfosarcina sp.]|nr:hypothetical protein [Desulfosarcina sp.]